MNVLEILQTIPQRVRTTIERNGELLEDQRLIEFYIRNYFRGLQGMTEFAYGLHIQVDVIGNVDLFSNFIMQDLPIQLREKNVRFYDTEAERVLSEFFFDIQRNDKDPYWRGMNILSVQPSIR